MRFLKIWKTTYHGTECVGRFANVELLVVPLAFSRRYIINDGISPDVGHCICLGDAEPSFTNEDANFTLIVGSFCESGMWIDVLPVCDDGCESLGEDDWMRRLVDLVGAIEARAVKLFGMLGIILAYAEYITSSDRRQDGDGALGEKIASLLDVGFSRLDDLIQVRDRSS